MTKAVAGDQIHRHAKVVLLAGVVGAARTHAVIRNTGGLSGCQGDLTTAFDGITGPSVVRLDDGRCAGRSQVAVALSAVADARWRVGFFGYDGSNRSGLECLSSRTYGPATSKRCT